MQQQMVTVSANDMSKAIAATGRVALYGILFDTNKADVKPESKPALVEIDKLLKADPTLKLRVVGHTDNQGTLDANIGLSKRRAEAVNAALVAQYGIAASRLSASASRTWRRSRRTRPTTGGRRTGAWSWCRSERNSARFPIPFFLAPLAPPSSPRRRGPSVVG